MSNPYFAFYPGDYLRDTIGLSCCEHGIYLLLLSVSWHRGPLPDDLDHLARLAANPPIEALRFILETYWTRTECGWLNARLEKERAKVEAKSLSAKESANKRWGLIHSNDANALPTQCERYANQNQNQNQEATPPPHFLRSSENAADESAVPTDGPARPRTPFQEIRDLWTEILPELPKPLSADQWTPARKTQIRARWQNELPDLETWRALFEDIRSSPFLMGKVQPRNGSRFRCDLFWITKPENLLKFQEGRYDA